MVAQEATADSQDRAQSNRFGTHELMTGKESVCKMLDSDRESKKVVDFKSIQREEEKAKRVSNCLNALASVVAMPLFFSYRCDFEFSHDCIVIYSSTSSFFAETLLYVVALCCHFFLHVRCPAFVHACLCTLVPS